MSGIIWFKCKGCGQPAGYCVQALDENPAGSVIHSKPEHLIRREGEPSNVPCAMYQQCDATSYWNMHKDAERLFEDESPVLVRA